LVDALNTGGDAEPCLEDVIGVAIDLQDGAGDSVEEGEDDEEDDKSERKPDQGENAHPGAHPQGHQPPSAFRAAATPLLIRSMLRLICFTSQSGSVLRRVSSSWTVISSA